MKEKSKEEQIIDFIKDAQSKLGQVMALQAHDMNAESNTCHTEVFVSVDGGEPIKYLVTTTVRPLTEELKQSIINPNN